MDHGPARAPRAPGQPLLWLFAGYPVWWILGVTELAAFTAGALLAVELYRERDRIEVPRGFLLWALFLAWVIGGIFLLQVSADNTDPTPSPFRYITWAFRLAWYLTATVVMLYAVTFRDRVPLKRLVQHAGWMFPTLVAGGFLGIVAPNLEIQSVAELLLPNSVTSIAFVRDLIHPTTAQVYSFQGAYNPRPSAPFPYSNDWGVTYACTVPFFVAGWVVARRGWQRVAGLALIALSTAPVVLSQNRGLWLALIAMLVFVVLHSLMGGHHRRVLIGLGMVLALGVLVLASPLRSVVLDRVSNEGGSDSGRQALADATVRTVVDRAPVTGLGTTRNVLGSFYSVAGADTATCPRCSPPALGTQGQLWLVIFSQGLVGVLLYFGFFLLQVFRAWRSTATISVAAMGVVVSQVVTAPFYNTLGPALLMVGLAAGVLASDKGTATARHAVEPSPPERLSAILAHLRDRGRLIGAFVVVGVLASVVWQATQAPRSVVQVRLLLPRAEGVYLPAEKADTMDTLAKMADTQPVLNAADSAADADASALRVSAVPNTRVLVLEQTTESPSQTTRSLTEAAQALSGVRAAELKASVRGELAGLNAETRRLAAAVAALDGAVGDAGELSPNARRRAQATSLLQTREQEALALSSVPRAPAQVLGSRTRHLLTEDWILSLVNGALIGLLAGVAAVCALPRRTRRRSDSLSPAQSGAL